jgi:hypothetical protein
MSTPDVVWNPFTDNFDYVAPGGGGGGGLTWVDVSGSFTPQRGFGYFITGMAEGTMPPGNQGDTIEFIIDTGLSSALTLTAGSGQIIRIGTAVTSSGGTLTSTAQGSTVELIFREAENAWIAGDNNGSWSFE